ncbi:hypothetical protein E2562_005561 [Oryza meyeriana var. granulata]|uniref:Uncharacterized protein n=1 Tax=Oryza meyeriana var. granulata TaxID=110450 RepID=A0A6G1F3V7_9ORYZ|nr:hypothetical protein E2562_005561 [Oryza meyeriana var. granulata]
MAVPQKKDNTSDAHSHQSLASPPPPSPRRRLLPRRLLPSRSRLLCRAHARAAARPPPPSLPTSPTTGDKLLEGNLIFPPDPTSNPRPPCRLRPQSPPP